MTAKEITIPTNKGPKKVLEEDIIRVEASSNYCKLFFSNEKPLVVAKVLHWFEEHLSIEIFCRVHRTHLINKMYVADVIMQSTLLLINGDVIKISRRKQTACNTILIYQVVQPVPIFR
jgi:two-component system, LytTR family, response regulator